MCVAFVACVVGVSAVAWATQPGTPGYIGLTQPYTFETGCGGIPIDPLNVVWFGTYAEADRVADGLSQYGGWTHNDYLAPFGAHSEAVKETSTAFGACSRDQTQRADGCAICSSRNHVRLFQTQTNGALYVTGDAHHDSTASIFDGCTDGILAGHYASDFNGPRDLIAHFWPGGVIHYDDWGNTLAIKQCNGSMPYSDGFVAVMRATNIP